MQIEQQFMTFVFCTLWQIFKKFDTFVIPVFSALRELNMKTKENIRIWWRKLVDVYLMIG
jgi:hypothetical protein